jgi:hypothetical protein
LSQAHLKKIAWPFGSFDLAADKRKLHCEDVRRGTSIIAIGYVALFVDVVVPVMFVVVGVGGVGVVGKI